MDQSLLPATKVSDLEFGAAGVFMLLLLGGKRVSAGTAFVMLAGGLICAYVFPDPAMHFFNAPEAYRGMAGFIIGLVGMQVCGAILTIAQSLRNDPMAVVREIPFFRFLSGKGEVNAQPSRDLRD